MVKGTKGFFESIAKLQIALDTESKKKTPKAISVIKEDRQAFGIILGNDIDLSEALKYPITSTSLSIGNPDGTLRKSPENPFGNFLIYQSSAIENQPLFQGNPCFCVFGDAFRVLHFYCTHFQFLSTNFLNTILKLTGAYILLLKTK